MTFPSTQKIFSINDQSYTMKQVTLGLQSRLEDEEISVTYSDIISECTDIPEAFQELIPESELEIICADVISFSSDKQTSSKGESKKAIELIAWLMNRGHLEAQHYRVDFVRVIIEEYVKETKAK